MISVYGKSLSHKDCQKKRKVVLFCFIFLYLRILFLLLIELECGVLSV